MAKHRQPNPFRLLQGGLSVPAESDPASTSLGALTAADRLPMCDQPVFVSRPGLFGRPEAIMGAEEITAICNGIGRLMRVQGGPEVPLFGGDMIRLRSTWQEIAPPQFRSLAIRTAGYFQKRPDGIVAALSVSACINNETSARKMKLLTFQCSAIHPKRPAAFAEATPKTLYTREPAPGGEAGILPEEEILEEIPGRNPGIVRVGQALAAFNFVRMATGQHWDRHHLPHLAEGEYYRGLTELDLPSSL